MKPLAEFPEAAARQIRFVLCDIDDTLTDKGRLSARAYTALEQLKDTGLKVVPVTGRPAGWCDLIARQWPVDGVVGENGAFYFHYDQAKRHMHRRFWHDLETRRRHRFQLDALAGRIIREVPGSAVAADQLYRESDLAIDYCEDVPPLNPPAVARIVDIFHEADAKAKVSSIHVNSWFGENDKSTMSRAFLKEVFGYDIAAQPELSVFVGDSPNDCPMFEAVGHAIGVANVREFIDQLAPPPQWIAQYRGGRGFAEIAGHLLAAHRRR
ncbi:MAG: Mannosyl-3-phosphoglycerate phosphatase [Gammaproteobacteria bacterium]|nr:Mannosyl-3-phosphoglycerate phosphatase [Gammaproteobacteria bacterium]